MGRTFLVLVIGIAGGSAGTYYFVHEPAAPLIALDGSNVSLADIVARAPAPGVAPQGASDAGPVGVAERAAVYQLAAQSDADALRALAKEVAATPASDARRFALGALLSRYAEIDPRDAVSFAADLKLEAELLAPLYQAWARQDASAALAMLRTGNPADARTIGLELLQVLGNDERTIERIIDAIPSIDADRFRLEAIRAKANVDPMAALEDALLLESGMLNTALESIAQIWAQRDVAEALRRADVIGDDRMRAVFQSALFTHWGRNEPEAMLAYIVDLDPETQQQALFGAGLQELARADPARVLELAERLPRQLAMMAQQIAMQRMAYEDPAIALAYADRLPLGRERQQLMAMIATGYAAKSPDAALAWAQGLQPAQPGVMAAVLGGLAQEDPERALDLALAMRSTQEQMQALQSIAMNGAMRSGSRIESIADRLLTAATPDIREGMLQRLTMMWSSRDPEGALDWMLANSENIPPGSFMQVAQRFGQMNPAAAAAYTGRIPNAARSAWISSVAQGYAQMDPQGAVSWIAQFQGEPGYASAVAAIAQQSAQYDAPAAARLLGTIDASAPESLSAAVNVAAQWAQTDPRTAAEWVLDLPTTEARSGAIDGVMRQWTGIDTHGARAWALSLPQGAIKDAALVPVIASVVADTGVPEQTLLSAFSTENARQQGLSRAVFGLARRNPAAARQFIADYITDPQWRQQAEQMLDASERSYISPGNFSISSSGVMMNPGTAPTQVIRQTRERN